MNVLRQLDGYTADYGKDYSHVALCPLKRSYYIEYDNIDRLLTEYCSITNFSSTVIGLAEKIIGALPVIVDIDIRIPVVDPPRSSLYSLNDIMDVIRIYHEIIHRVVDDVVPLTCVVLEKPAYTTDDGMYIKNGFHLHFPWVFLDINDHRNHVLAHAREQINQLFQHRYAYTDVFDDHILNVPWLLYGSRKSVSQSPYTITHIFNDTLIEVDRIEAFADYSVFDHNGDRIMWDHRDMGQSIDLHMPRILSILPYGRKVCQISIPVMDSYRVRQVTACPARFPVGEETWASNLQKATVLVGMLSAERAERRNEWMSVGWALFNSCGPGIDSLNLWIEFSKRASTKFDYNTCIHAWSKMKPSNMSLGTLRMYASIDDPTAYGHFRFECSRNALFSAVVGAHYDIATILHREYGNFFKCASITGKRWYVFEDSIWKRTEDGVALRKKFAELVGRFEKSITEIKSSGDQPLMTADLIEKRVEQVKKIIIKLKTTAFKECVMRECAELFHDEAFESKLDSNPDIIAFNNGVYDLYSHTFRPGLSTDYISKKMTIDYEEFDEDDPRVHEVNDFFQKIFPDPSVREYFMNVASTIFRGGNSDKKVFVLTGNGDNGKSVTESIFEKMLGPYAIKLPTTLLTGKRAQSSSASPELARTGNGVRWAILQEPDARDELNVGLLKELSGNDTFFARDLYQKGTDLKEVNPMFKIALICNEPPSISRGDRATWERIRVIPFESTFVNADDVPDTYEEQVHTKRFAKDPKFYDKIPGLLAPLAWMLLKNYKRIAGKIGKEPEKVLLATDKYKAKNDILRQYLAEYVESDTESTLTLTEIYASFKTWYRDGSGLSMSSLPSRYEFSDKLSMVWGDSTTKEWKGYRFKQIGSNNGSITF